MAGPDLATLEVKNRLSHVAGGLHKIRHGAGSNLLGPEGVVLSIHLNIAELQEAAHVVCRAWFP